MAKKKHYTKHRKHRVGAASLNPASPIVKLAAVGVGYFLGDTINPQIDTLTAKIVPAPAVAVPATTTTAAVVPTTGLSSLGMNANTAGLVAELGLGGYLLMSKKKSMIKSIGGGILAGAGLQRLLKTMGIVSGYQAVPVIGRRVHGYQATPVIGATPAQLQGMGATPAQLQGFRVNGYNPVGSGSNVMGSISGLYDGTGINGTDGGSGITSDNGSGLMN